MVAKWPQLLSCTQQLKPSGLPGTFWPVRGDLQRVVRKVRCGVNAFQKCLIGLVWVAAASSAVAQEADPPEPPLPPMLPAPLSSPLSDGSELGAIQPYLEYRKHVEAAQNISPLDSGLFGEQVSLYNGNTSFSVTDIDIPGNGTLPVRLSRRYAVDLQPQNEYSGYDSLLRGMGSWDIDVPYMAGTYDVDAGPALRCNGAYIPPLTTSLVFRRAEVWQGISINVPGRGNTSAMGVQASAPQPTVGGPYKLTTSERDVFDCIPMKAGFTGQGFRMTTANGDRYYFDVATTRTAARLFEWMYTSSIDPPLPVFIDRDRLYLLASKIEDRFGNTVEFQYNSNGHPTRIWANDGREINLAYTDGRLTTATSHGRTWTYQYPSGASGLAAPLLQVTQPDGSKWQYTYSNDLSPSPDGSLPPLPWCGGFPTMLDTTLTFTATHPSGASGTFNFGNRRHYRSGVHASECIQFGDPSNPEYELAVPHFFDVMSILSKTITGPGLAAMTWSYTYPSIIENLWGAPLEPAVYPCTTCTSEKKVTLTNPDSTKTRYTFGMRYHDNDGRQLKVETLRADNTVMRTENSTYMTEAQAAVQVFYGAYGSNLGGVADPASVRIRPVTNRTIIQDGRNFVWQVASSCSGTLCFDTFARPTRVTRSSNVTGNPTRSELTAYHDHLGKWVLGQVKKVTCVAPTSALPAGCGAGGTEMFERTYDPTFALPLVTERFGKVEQTLTWETAAALSGGQRGTIKTVADGAGNLTTLTNWKRGTPRSVKYPGTPEVPAGALHTADVNDSGWLSWGDDENGFRTSYTYDAMGRVASVVYPTGDSTAWNSTTQVFEQVAAVEYGIPANHW
jgi:YD repeat-containing protein